MKKALGFAASTVGLIGVCGMVLALLFKGATDRRALWISAIFAFLVQLHAYGIARGAGAKRMIAGWGLGAAFRFLMLIVYGFVVIPGTGLPATSAILSFAVFLFATTLIEPLFLTA